MRKTSGKSPHKAKLAGLKKALSFKKESRAECEYNGYSPALTDYDIYFPSRREKSLYYTFACGILFGIGWLFYKSFLLSALLCLLSKLFYPMYIDYLKNRRKDRLLEGFRDALYSMSCSFAAGRQMPYALSEAASQLGETYGKDSDISTELDHIVRVYSESHGNLQDLLGDFARRSGLEEIRQFASSFRICAKSGGDIEGVALKCSDLLLEKLSLRSEMKSLTSQKKLDLAVLFSMPLLIVLMLNLTSSDYLSPLYESLAGRIIMSACIAAIGSALYLSIKILDLKF